MRDPENTRDFDNLVHGLEANMENLRVMRETQGFLPEHGWGLEMIIEAQMKLLEELVVKADTMPDADSNVESAKKLPGDAGRDAEALKGFANFYKS
jgi:hypothetical protein